MTDTVPAGHRVVVWRKHRVNPKRKRSMRTICEVLIELHRDAEQRGDTLSIARIAEATDMAKRMQTRLMHYAQGRVGLFATEDGLAWADKGKLLKLTSDEQQLIEEYRRCRSNMMSPALNEQWLAAWVALTASSS